MKKNRLQTSGRELLSYSRRSFLKQGQNLAAAMALGLVAEPLWADQSEGSGKPAQPWVPPKVAKIDYTMQGVAKGIQASGSGVLNLTYNANQRRYDLSLEISAMLFSFLYQSKGEYQPHVGIVPHSFREKRIGKDRTVYFDYGSNILRFDWKKKEEAWPLVNGIQDVNSVMMQIAYLMGSKPEMAKIGQKFSFPVARMGSIKFWDFSVIAKPSVHTKEGAIETWHISRLRPETDSDLQVEFWLAPSLGFLPQQIYFNKNDGDYVLVTLDRVKTLTL